MNKKMAFWLALLLVSGSAFAQPKYIIQFKDRAGTALSLANPGQFLTPRAIARRTRYNIAIDSADMPVLQRYIDSVRLAGNVTVLNTSRWFNQVCIQTTDPAALNKINAFPFVVGGAKPFGLRAVAETAVNKPLNLPDAPDNTVLQTPQGIQGTYNYGLSFNQIHLHNGEFLHNHGFSGQGMQMAVTDGGFLNYLTLPTFDSVRNNGQILGTWDFVANEVSVTEDHQHGTQCFSTIAANMPGSFVGSAPKGSFYLYRTENTAGENPVEEQNWVAAAERADSLGVDVVTVSLGYTYFDNPTFNHNYATDMNGNTTLISRAADIAAKKGMLVTVAAGNDGNTTWRFISAPADADSVLAVGAVNNAGTVVGFSSYGPSSDGQVKPDVAAVGSGAVIANVFNGQPSANGSGTSFACPNMAGLVTCLWQAFPEVNNMAVIDAVRRASSRYDNPNDRMGYGLPDMKNAFVRLVKKLYSGQASIANCKVGYNWQVKADTSVKLVVERKLASAAGYTPVQTIQATGSFTTKSFSFADDVSALPNQTVQYRIAMSIGSDTTFYLDSATVNHSASCNAIEKIAIGPNPVNTPNLTVNIVRTVAVDVQLVLHNTAGQQLYTVKAQQAAGGGTYSIPMRQLPRGVYYITVYINGEKAVVKKVVK
jgi:serine protease AprX